MIKKLFVLTVAVLAGCSGQGNPGGTSISSNQYPFIDINNPKAYVRTIGQEASGFECGRVSYELKRVSEAGRKVGSELGLKNKNDLGEAMAKAFKHKKKMNKLLSYGFAKQRLENELKKRCRRA